MDEDEVDYEEEDARMDTSGAVHGEADGGDADGDVDAEGEVAANLDELFGELSDDEDAEDVGEAGAEVLGQLGTGVGVGGGGGGGEEEADEEPTFAATLSRGFVDADTREEENEENGERDDDDLDRRDLDHRDDGDDDLDQGYIRDDMDLSDAEIRRKRLSELNENVPTRRQITAPLSLPKINPPGGSGTDTYLAKLPAFLAVEPQPFDREQFLRSDPVRELDSLAPGALEDFKLKRENTIRWRYEDPKTKEKVSNARIVRWSDNTFSLLLGDEMFDCQLKSMARDQHYLAVRHPPPATTNAVAATQTSGGGLVPHTMLQTQARLKNTIMFVPSNKAGATHKRMAAAIAKRHQKAVGTKLFANLSHDPLAARREAEKTERDQAKQAKKLRSERSKVASSFADDGLGRSYGSRHNNYSDDEVDLRRSRARPPNPDQYEEDFVDNDEDEEEVAMSDDSEEERRREARLKSSKRSLVRSRAEDEDESRERTSGSGGGGAGGGAGSSSAVAEVKRVRRIIDSDEDE
ncbi:Leo1-like protein-domain-containing protein [Chytriomyces sp. MP71]|nr:Leo1-like protein-domain-containing protein [Chytriomyces sp. MP71]